MIGDSYTRQTNFSKWPMGPGAASTEHSALWAGRYHRSMLEYMCFQACALGQSCSKWWSFLIAVSTPDSLVSLRGHDLDSSTPLQPYVRSHRQALPRPARAKSGVCRFGKRSTKKANFDCAVQAGSFQKSKEPLKLRKAAAAAALAAVMAATVAQTHVQTLAESSLAGFSKIAVVPSPDQLT